MCAQTRNDSAEHGMALLTVDAKGNQSHGHSTWLLCKVLFCTLFSLMLALSLVVCVLYGYQYGEHSVQNTQIEEHSTDPPRGSDGLVVKQPQSMDAGIAPGHVETSSSQTHISMANTAVFNRISKKSRRKLRTRSRANMSSFLRIVEDLLHEDLLKLPQKILCLDTHADKEVVALRERGFKDAQGIKSMHALLNSKHKHQNPQIKKLADHNFDFFFTSMFDRIPYPALFVTEIEQTLKVGGLAAMHVSLNKWRNKYIAGEPGHGIKPVTLLFQHSEIVYVSSADAPGLDTIIVFKKTTHAKAKQVDQMEMNKKQLHGNPSESVNQVKLSSKHKCREYAEERQLKSPRYITRLQGKGSLLYTSARGTFLRSVTHFRGEVLMKKSMPTGLPGASNLFVQGLSSVARRAIVQGNSSASDNAVFSDGQVGIEDNMAVGS